MVLQGGSPRRRQGRGVPSDEGLRNVQKVATHRVIGSRGENSWFSEGEVPSEGGRGPFE